LRYLAPSHQRNPHDFESPGPVEENWRDAISSIEEIIDDARNGRMFILVDHEDRENEGDLVIPAQMCTPEAINFMATHGRGLICLALPGERIDALGLPLMSTKNSSRHETAFTVSIEAREGVTTGISAHDRARTVAVAIDPSRPARRHRHAGPHLSAARARRRRAGARRPYRGGGGHGAAGRAQPLGRDLRDHERRRQMARLPDLVAFAQRHGLKIGTISDLIAYRRRHDNLVRESAVAAVTSAMAATG
jgi:3,4-dihydroxy 2-butanone 4-phosphate synthase / GTP cyclohydrolase II